MTSIASGESQREHGDTYRLSRIDHIMDGSDTIKLGGKAQDATTGPIRGYELHNPDASNDLWIADNGSTAAPNASGSIRVPANGGTYWTPHWWPDLMQRVSLYGAVTGQAYTLRYW